MTMFNYCKVLNSGIDLLPWNKQVISKFQLFQSYSIQVSSFYHVLSHLLQSFSYFSRLLSGRSLWTGIEKIAIVLDIYLDFCPADPFERV
jgi:hypothetical protein